MNDALLKVPTGVTGSGGIEVKPRIGNIVINGAGVRVKVKKECLKCGTLMGPTVHGKYKCCVKRSCPGWTASTIKKVEIPSYMSGLKRAIKFARITGSGDITGLLEAKRIFEECEKAHKSSPRTATTGYLAVQDVTIHDCKEHMVGQSPDYWCELCHERIN